MSESSSSRSSKPNLDSATGVTSEPTFDREHFGLREFFARAGRVSRKNGELGQMSIFLALIFQVLFVFFAMVINIGLLVHDKINLQNAVDLGAFYAAQRQADILNEIAHINYQIRQDYKLLAWRYWVVGTLGRDDQKRNMPPVRTFPLPTASGPPPAPRPLPDAPRPYGAGEEVPVACLASPIWYEFAQLSTGIPNENYCWLPYNFVSTPIAKPPSGGPPATAALNALINQFSQAASSSYARSCENASPLSWAYVADIIGAYKMSVARRKTKIWALRAQLVSEQMTDKRGDTVRSGVEQTVKKNLTEENLASFEGLEFINGLSKGSCAGGAMPGETTVPEVLTAPGLYFALLTSNPNGSCAFNNAFQNQYTLIPGPPNAGAGFGVAPWDPSGILRNFSGGEPQPTDPLHSTLGFEKNPWCMAYVGVKARTRPRKPFAPFGKPVSLEARAFAQPFGGRVGPWYGRTWTRGAAMSDSPAPPAPGTGSGPLQVLNPARGQEGRTDLMTSPRIMPGAGGYSYTPLWIPNFSRFPGDQLGLRSALAQGMLRRLFSLMPLSGAAIPPHTDARMHLTWFINFANIGNTGDAGAWDEPGFQAMGGIPPALQAYRQAELAAVAPDLFDITYYSIDPRGAQNYTQVQTNNPGRYAPYYPGGASSGDVGWRAGHPTLQLISVEDHVSSLVTGSGGTDETLLPLNYWSIRDWRHLLTAWAPHRVTNFTFPTERFGQCALDAKPDVMIPGKCVAGGRVGYSVRLVSREHLNGIWNVGGDGGSGGPLLNPPGDDSQF